MGNVGTITPVKATNWETFYNENILGYFQNLKGNPFELITLIIDLAIVIFLFYWFFKAVKGSRAWQLIKGIALLLVATWVSGFLNFRILNAILTAIMNIGLIAVIIIFQPELRRALEQIGTNKFTHLFGIEKDLETRTREDIYKIVIAVEEMAKTKTGALIVMQRDIGLNDIVSTGIEINSEISPQLLVNIFVPNTPLHDGAVIISNNKISAAACILPLANGQDISKDLGTRHRAAVGISKETDAVVIVVSEESGKISIAKDGTLIADVREDELKKILIKSIITNRLDNKEKNKIEKLKNIKKVREEKEDK